MQITGSQIRAARKALGENQADFSIRFGIDRSTLSAWETAGPPVEGTAPVLIERVLAEIGQLPTSEAAE